MDSQPDEKKPAAKKFSLGGMKPPAPPAGAPGVTDCECPDTVSSAYFFKKGGGSVDFDRNLHTEEEVEEKAGEKEE